MAAGPNAPFTWQAHPARERPRAAAFAVLIVGGAAAAVWLSIGLVWGVSAAIVLVLALHRFFFASNFSIDEMGIDARYLLRRQRLNWRDVRRFLHDEHGGYFSTRACRSRMDAFAGMHILFGRHREEVIRHVREHFTLSAPPAHGIQGACPSVAPGSGGAA